MLLLHIALLVLLFVPAQARAEATWRWPVRGSLLERFHYGPDPFRAGQHRGIDIAAPPGTAVRSACAGRVRFAGTAGDAGRTVSVACGALTATYLHLRSITVRRGQRVGVGDRLGAVGASGRPGHRAPHLHLGARRTGERFAYVDPLSLLGGGGAGDQVPAIPALRNPPPVPAVRDVRPPSLGRAPAPAPLTAPAAGSAPAAGARREHAPPWTLWVGVGLLAIAAPLPAIRWRRGRRPARRRDPAASPAATRA